MSFKHEKFMHKKYYAHGGLGDGSGLSADNAAAIVDDASLMIIEAGMVIEKAYVVISSAISGTSNLDVGDDDDADGFVDGSLSVTLGTPGMYGWDAKNAGAYLRIQTAGATDAADIFVVPNAKFYSAAGKEVKLDVTGSSLGGAFQVVVEGYKVA